MTAPTRDPVHRPASYYQRDWVLACRDSTSFCSTPLAWDLHGPLDVAALTRALEELPARHEALRTAFRARDGDVEQVVWPRVDVRLPSVDLSGSEAPVAALNARIIEEAERPRVLVTPPLWHLLLLRLAPRHHVLAMFVHHLVFDGWSHGVLHDELTRCLRAATGRRPPRLPRLRMQLGDFAARERAVRDSSAEAWWREHLRSLPPITAVPPPGGRFVSCPLPTMPRRTAEALQGVAAGHGATLNTALLAAVAMARRRFLGEDVVIGVTLAGRERPESYRVIGPLLDHVPVRVNLSGPTTMGSLLRRVDRAYREAMSRRLPLGLVRQVVPEDLRARGGRLFDTRYNYLPTASSGEVVVPTPGGELRVAPRAIDPATLAPRHTEDHPEVLPLSYVLRRQHDGQLAGEVCGHGGLYPPDVLSGLAGELTDILRRMVAGAAPRLAGGRV